MKRAMVFLLATVLLGAEGKENAAKKDQASMQGDWSCESYVISGFKLEDDDAQAYFRTVKGNTYTVFRYRKALGKGTFTLDAGKKPRTIDVTPAGGKVKPILGIYKIEKDKLTICHAAPGKPRPAVFSAKEGSGHTLVVWVREKK
jgi:uncharacterized protein (TIGR03067 family)